MISSAKAAPWTILMISLSAFCNSWTLTEMLMFTISIAQISIWIWSNALYKFQRGRTEGAVLPVRRSAPEHNLYMTSKQHSITVRWIRLGVNFEEGRNRSARRKPSRSGWVRLKPNPHTTFVVEVEGVIDVPYASLASRTVQHRVFYLDGHPSRYQPRPTGLNFGEQTGNGVFPLVIAVPHQKRCTCLTLTKRDALAWPWITWISSTFLLARTSELLLEANANGISPLGTMPAGEVFHVFQDRRWFPNLCR